MSAERTTRIFKELKAEDFRTLIGIELGMSRYEFVPVEAIMRFSELGSSETEFRLKRLHKLGLIQRWIGPYIGYVVNSIGYDCLALNALVKSGTIEALGKPLGIGKEADVYDALGSGGRRIAVKFHRLGRTSFRKTRRTRGYVAKMSPVPWLIQSRLAAEKEFEALRLVYPRGVSVPEPISQNRHVLVMGLIEGAPLADYMEIPNPRGVLQEVLDNVRTSYLKAGVIHADLSEYNVLIKPDAHILIIDWPQFVTKDHLNALSLLTRDVKNILSYFRRKFAIKVNLSEALELVTSSS